MKRINRISKVAMVAIVAAVLIASVGAYAYWSVQQQIADNKVASGSMTFSVVDSGATTLSPVNLIGVMPGDQGIAKNWEVKIGAAPTSGDDLNFRVSGVSDTKTLADNVQIAFALTTGFGEDYWFNADGSLSKIVFGEDPDASYVNHLSNMSKYDGVSWSKINGANIMHTDETRHIKVYYSLPLDCDSNCHDDTATFNVAVEAVQHH